VLGRYRQHGWGIGDTHSNTSSGSGLRSKKLEIKRRGFISCAPLESAADNHGYICWGKIYEVVEELELLE
jgi:hypothetical protein